MMSLGFLCGGCDILYNLIVKEYLQYLYKAHPL